MVDILIYLLIFVIIAGAAWFILNKVPLEPTIRIWVICIFVVIAAIVLINLLLGMTGGGGLSLRMRG